MIMETVAVVKCTWFGCFAAHHVVTRKQFLQELGLFGLHRLDDELVIAGEVKPGAARARVGQLDQRLLAY